MTTARVLDGILKGARNGAFIGALTGTVGTAAVKICGMLGSTPFSQVVKVNALSNAILGGICCGYSNFFHKPGSLSVSAAPGQAGLNTVILATAGLLGEALTCATVGSSTPKLELALALLIGNGIICYLVEQKTKEQEAHEAPRPSP